jgi:hypothetical protein
MISFFMCNNPLVNIIDSFGFAKYFDVRDAELCIRGFYKLGYEVGFARVCESY